MVYQLGKYGVLKFKNFLKALDEGDLSRASEEMLDSLWARQTPNRAKDLSSIISELDNGVWEMGWNLKPPPDKIDKAILFLIILFLLLQL